MPAVWVASAREASPGSFASAWCSLSRGGLNTLLSTGPFVRGRRLAESSQVAAVDASAHVQASGAASYFMRARQVGKRCACKKTKTFIEIKLRKV